MLFQFCEICISFVIKYFKFFINSLHAELFGMLFVICGYFLKINVFKISFRNTIRVSNSLDPDQEVLSGLICIQTVCKGYLQTTIVPSSRERVKINVSFP